MFISDCKTFYIKFDGMDINAWSSTGAACFLWQITLASSKSCINMKGSQKRADGTIEILPDLWWCLFNSFYWWQQRWHECCDMKVEMIVPATNGNWCYYLVTLHQCNANQWTYEFRSTYEIDPWWGYSWTSWYLLMLVSYKP